MATDTGRPPRPDRLIHVGAHKTGTTTVQAAFHSNRAALSQAGVLYLGDQLQPTTAVKALTGALGGDVRERGLRQWSELVQQAGSAPGAVVLSSEFLCEAEVPVARRVVEELGRGARRPLHVVVTLRPLAKILPSQWQQFVQSGNGTPLAEWLEWALDAFDDDPVPLVWRRHRHHDVVDRWVQAAGAENVTVVVADESRPQFVLDVFERMLSLPASTLVPPSLVANRSLTLEEAEAVRLLNVSYKQAQKRSQAADRNDLPDLTMDQRMAIWRSLKRTTPDPRYHRVALPASVLERVRARAQEMVEAIESLGVGVIGDLESLTTGEETLPEDVLRVEDVRPQLVADVAMALLTRVGSPDPARRDVGAPPSAATAALVSARRRSARVLARVARRVARTRSASPRRHLRPID